MILDYIRNMITLPRILPKPKAKEIFTISSYDETIKKYALKENIPWLLVCAVIWQESRFNPKAVSSAKCKGLMQLAPCVYEPANIDPFDTRANIQIGCSHLATMYGVFKKEINFDRWKFALASYNGGVGYTCSAQKLAEIWKADSTKWCQVSTFLKDAKCKERSCDWIQIVTYVDLVITKFYEYMFLELKNGQ